MKKREVNNTSQKTNKRKVSYEMDWNKLIFQQSNAEKIVKERTSNNSYLKSQRTSMFGDQEICQIHKVRQARVK